MIESIAFKDFKALRDTTLPLTPFTLLLGPNGSGKTSVLQALDSIANNAAARAQVPRPNTVIHELNWQSLMSAAANGDTSFAEVRLRLQFVNEQFFATVQWHPTNQQVKLELYRDDMSVVKAINAQGPLEFLGRMQVFAFDSAAIAAPVPVTSHAFLQQDGGGLAAVLDNLKDDYPERWELLLAEMREWLPEFDHILFDKPQQGAKGIVLRTKAGGYRIAARELSQGTLVALALLTLAYLPQPPTVVGLEEIDRGLHPRLLRHLRDALYRLSYPESCGEARSPVQVIATTHSPYLLDLYRDHPEEVVLAEKQGLDVTMKRLSDIDHFEEILGDSPLSDVWYSGVLGGVSVKP